VHLRRDVLGLERQRIGRGPTSRRSGRNPRRGKDAPKPIRGSGATDPWGINEERLKGEKAGFEATKGT